MSATSMNSVEHAPGGHESHEQHDELHATFGGYMIGFGLSVLLTAIPFWLVMSDVIDNKQVTGLIITAFAAVQIVVHMIYFLHLNSHSEQGWTMLSTVFAIIMVAITLIGSLWVMYHMNANMMPVHTMTGSP